MVGDAIWVSRELSGTEQPVGTLVVCNPDKTLWDPRSTSALQWPQVSQVVVALNGGDHTHQLSSPVLRDGA